MAPARAKREYRARPWGASGFNAAAPFCTTPSNFCEPVEAGGGDAAIVADVEEG